VLERAKSKQTVWKGSREGLTGGARRGLRPEIRPWRSQRPLGQLRPPALGADIARRNGFLRPDDRLHHLLDAEDVDRPPHIVRERRREALRLLPGARLSPTSLAASVNRILNGRVLRYPATGHALSVVVSGLAGQERKAFALKAGCNTPVCPGGGPSVRHRAPA